MWAASKSQQGFDFAVGIFARDGHRLIRGGILLAARVGAAETILVESAPLNLHLDRGDVFAAGEAARHVRQQVVFAAKDHAVRLKKMGAVDVGDVANAALAAFEMVAAALQVHEFAFNLLLAHAAVRQSHLLVVVFAVRLVLKGVVRFERNAAGGAAEMFGVVVEPASRLLVTGYDLLVASVARFAELLLPISEAERLTLHDARSRRRHLVCVHVEHPLARRAFEALVMNFARANADELLRNQLLARGAPVRRMGRRRGC